MGKVGMEGREGSEGRSHGGGEGKREWTGGGDFAALS